MEGGRAPEEYVKLVDSSRKRKISEAFDASNTENRFFVEGAYHNCLFTPTKRTVIEEMGAYLEKYPQFTEPRGYRKFNHDPVKTRVRLFHPEEEYPNDDTLPGIDQFANLYIENPDPLFSLMNSNGNGDIRKYLTLFSRVGCFSRDQGKVAYKLKKFYDIRCHNHQVTDDESERVYKNARALLESIPFCTDVYIKKLDNGWRNGAVTFLQSSEGEEHKKENIMEISTPIQLYEDSWNQESINAPSTSSSSLQIDDEESSAWVVSGLENEVDRIQATKPQENAASVLSYSDASAKTTVKSTPTYLAKGKVLVKKPRLTMKPDLRFDIGQQLQIGPIPERVEYVKLKNVFGQEGQVLKLFVKSTSVEEHGNIVKYGYVVFKESKDAKNLLKKGSVLIMTCKIKLTAF